MVSDTPPSRPRKRLTSTLVITLIALTLALGMRLWGLSSEPVWLDEVYSVLLSEGSAEQILEANARDVHPPLYYLGLGGWRQGYGSSPAGIRSYSLLWSLIGVVFTILLASAAGLGSVGVALAGFLAAVNPLDIFFAQETRMYAQSAALGTASTWVLWRWLVARQDYGERLAQGVWLALYVSAATLLLLTLYLGAFVLLAQGLFVFVHLGIRRDWWGVLAYAGTGLVTLGACLPWLVYMRSHGPHKLGRLDWISEPTIKDLLSPFFRQFYVGRMIPREALHQTMLVVAAMISIIVLATVFHAWRKRHPASGAAPYLFWMTSVPLVLAFLVSHLYRPVYFTARFPVLVVPSFLVLIAISATLLPKRWQRIGLPVLALAVMASGSVIQQRQITKPGMRNFAELYHHRGPPDHIVLLPPDHTITASYELGFPLVNSNQHQIQGSLEQRRETVIWVGVKRNYLDTADPRVRRVYDWLLSLGPAESLGIVDRLELWQIRVSR